MKTKKGQCVLEFCLASPLLVMCFLGSLGLVLHLTLRIDADVRSFSGARARLYGRDTVICNQDSIRCLTNGGVQITRNLSQKRYLLHQWNLWTGQKERRFQ